MVLWLCLGYVKVDSVGIFIYYLFYMFVWVVIIRILYVVMDVYISDILKDVFNYVYVLMCKYVYVSTDV